MMTIERESWRQFGVGLALMLPWPVGAASIQPLHRMDAFDPADYLIYLVGLSWDLLWEPVEKIQAALSSPADSLFTIALVGVLVLMWPVIASLPLFTRWRGKQIIGLWAIQFAYAGSQAISGYFYAKSFLL